MATFAEQFAKIAARYDGPQVGDEPESDNRWCKLCHQLGIVNENGYCSRCQEDVDRGYTISAKAGRCCTGMQADSGTLFHIRMLGENGPDRIPLCGKPPGRHSAGWSTWRPAEQQATCPQCLKRLQAQ